MTEQIDKVREKIAVILKKNLYIWQDGRSIGGQYSASEQIYSEVIQPLVEQARQKVVREMGKILIERLDSKECQDYAESFNGFLGQPNKVEVRPRITAMELYGLTEGHPLKSRYLGNKGDTDEVVEKVS